MEVVDEGVGLPVSVSAMLAQDIERDRGISEVEGRPLVGFDD
jgi:hypothetical protein